MRPGTIYLISVIIICTPIISALSSSAEGTISKPTKGYSDYNSSQNNSSIRFDGQNRIIQAPATISIGRGYYSTHPINYRSEIGSDTWIKNERAAASMHQDISYAHGINGETEMAASDSSNSDSGYNQDNSEFGGSSTTHMKIDETVTDGQVHFGVLQGSDASGQNKGFDGTDHLIDAWKTPAMEIDEDYIGTYHIYKNMTINTRYSHDLWSGSWLDCCSDSYFDMDRQYPSSISADKVFDCRCQEI